MNQATFFLRRVNSHLFRLYILKYIKKIYIGTKFMLRHLNGLIIVGILKFINRKTLIIDHAW